MQRRAGGEAGDPWGSGATCPAAGVGGGAECMREAQVRGVRGGREGREGAPRRRTLRRKGSAGRGGPRSAWGRQPFMRGGRVPINGGSGRGGGLEAGEGSGLAPEDPEEALESWVCSWPEPHFGRTPEAVGAGLLPSGASGKDSRVLEEAATPLRRGVGWWPQGDLYACPLPLAPPELSLDTFRQITIGRGLDPSRQSPG